MLYIYVVFGIGSKDTRLLSFPVLWLTRVRCSPHAELL